MYNDYFHEANLYLHRKYSWCLIWKFILIETIFFPSAPFQKEFTGKNLLKVDETKSVLTLQLGQDYDD